MQAPRGVCEDQVVVPGRCALDGVEHDRARVTAFGPAHDRNPCALGPQLELLSGRRPEGVSGGKDDGAAVCDLATGDLADRRRLSDPVHSHEEPDIRRTLFETERHAAGRVERLAKVFLERVENGFGPFQVAGADPRPEVFDQSRRRLHADIGPQECFFQVVPGRLVDRPACTQRPYVPGEGPARLSHPLAQVRRRSNWLRVRPRVPTAQAAARELRQPVQRAPLRVRLAGAFEGDRRLRRCR